MTLYHSPNSAGKSEEQRDCLPLSGSANDFLEDWLGPAPTDEEAAELTRLSLARGQQLREDLSKNSINDEEVQNRLGVGPAGIQALLEDRRLLAIIIDGERLFPEFQFDNARHDGTVAGLAQVLPVLDFSPLAQALWLTRPHPILSGQKPIELLRAGCIGLVVDAASGAGHGQD